MSGRKSRLLTEKIEIKITQNRGPSFRRYAQMPSLNDIQSQPNEPEICRCVVVSNAHMTQSDSEILDSLSLRLSGEEGACHWIHPTRYGFLIRLSATSEATEELRRAGLSDDFCHVVTFLSEKCQASMIHFDADADILEGFSVHNW
ncbi:hypothetical protein AI28_07345 [bacteria symbiont BFo1 of Frankliniella occidentalis]|nr:hypothetical protein AI28_07345 [bacteria symbiont BFo1 of Frankliniella occidentalis]